VGSCGWTRGERTGRGVWPVTLLLWRAGEAPTRGEVTSVSLFGRGGSRGKDRGGTDHAGKRYLWRFSTGSAILWALRAALLVGSANSPVRGTGVALLAGEGPARETTTDGRAHWKRSSQQSLGFPSGEAPMAVASVSRSSSGWCYSGETPLASASAARSPKVLLISREAPTAICVDLGVWRFSREGWRFTGTLLAMDTVTRRVPMAGDPHRQVVVPLTVGAAWPTTSGNANSPMEERGHDDRVMMGSGFRIPAATAGITLM
jgi:hypothetical protein